MDSSSGQLAVLNNDQLDQVDALCDQFESEWRAGNRASIESIMANCDPTLWSVLLGELVRQERELRVALGESPSRDEYTRRFPSQSQIITAIWEEPGDSHSSASWPTLADTKQRSRFVPPPRGFGRYEVLREIGRGGMGAVFLAHDRHLDRDVALKVPFSLAEGDREVIERFRREARAMATVRHPNLCPVYDVGEIDGWHFLSMAYIAGKPLSDDLRDGQTWPQDRAAELVRKLSLAVDRAHAAGLVHRDLKPANIMIDAQGEPVIMDFGLARREAPGEEFLTHSKALMGSPAYMAPEQVDGRHDEVGPSTDVYALGVILYQLLCGRRPYEGALGTVLAKVAAGNPLPPSQRGVKVDPALEQICLKAMAKVPGERYSTTVELAGAIDEYLKRKSQPAHIPTSARSRSAWVKVACLAGALLVAAIGIWSWRREPLGSAMNVATSTANGTAGSSKAVVNNSAEKPAATTQANGWISLLETDDLSHWRRTGEAEWHLQNGVLRGEGVNYGRLMHDQLVRDFELELEYKLPPLGDSGVFLRADTEGSFNGVEYLEVVLFRDYTVSSGMVFAMPSVGAPNEIPDDWNRLYVRLVGTHLTTKVNDGFVVDAELVRDGKPVSPGAARFEGVIGFQACPGKSMEIRNVRLRPIESQTDRERGEVIADSGQRLESKQTCGVSLGDLDGDKDLDAFQLSIGGPSRVWLNDGKGQMQDSQARYGNADGFAVALGDLDGDADLDAFVANSGGKPNQVWLNDGGAKFKLSEQEFDPAESSDVALADLNGDGRLDAVVTDYRGHHVDIFINDGGATFTRMAKIDVRRPTGVATADLDQDGRQDFAVTAFDHVTRVWMNAGGGTFSEEKQVAEGRMFTSVAAADLNHDNYSDLYLTSAEGSIVLLNKSGRGFEEPHELGQTVVETAALVDLNADRHLDAVEIAGGWEDNTTRQVWYGDGTGNFTPRQTIRNVKVQAVAAGDLNGDRLPDVWFGAFDKPDEVWFNATKTGTPAE